MLKLTEPCTSGLFGVAYDTAASVCEGLLEMKTSDRLSSTAISPLGASMLAELMTAPARDKPLNIHPVGEGVG